MVRRCLTWKGLSWYGVWWLWYSYCGSSRSWLREVGITWATGLRNHIKFSDILFIRVECHWNSQRQDTKLTYYEYTYNYKQISKGHWASLRANMQSILGQYTCCVSHLYVSSRFRDIFSLPTYHTQTRWSVLGPGKNTSFNNGNYAGADKRASSRANYISKQVLQNLACGGKWATWQWVNALYA